MDGCSSPHGSDSAAEDLSPLHARLLNFLGADTDMGLGASGSGVGALPAAAVARSVPTGTDGELAELLAMHGLSCDVLCDSPGSSPCSPAAAAGGMVSAETIAPAAAIAAAWELKTVPRAWPVAESGDAEGMLPGSGPACLDGTGVLHPGETLRNCLVAPPALDHTSDLVRQPLEMKTFRAVGRPDFGVIEVGAAAALPPAPEAERRAIGEAHVPVAALATSTCRASSTLLGAFLGQDEWSSGDDAVELRTMRAPGLGEAMRLSRGLGPPTAAGQAAVAATAVPAVAAAASCGRSSHRQDSPDDQVLYGSVLGGEGPLDARLSSGREVDTRLQPRGDAIFAATPASISEVVPARGASGSSSSSSMGMPAVLPPEAAMEVLLSRDTAAPSAATTHLGSPWGGAFAGGSHFDFGVAAECHIPAAPPERGLAAFGGAASAACGVSMGAHGGHAASAEASHCQDGAEDDGLTSARRPGGVEVIVEAPAAARRREASAERTSTSRIPVPRSSSAARRSPGAGAEAPPSAFLGRRVAPTSAELPPDVTSSSGSAPSRRPPRGPPSGPTSGGGYSGDSGLSSVPPESGACLAGGVASEQPRGAAARSGSGSRSRPGTSGSAGSCGGAGLAAASVPTPRRSCSAEPAARRQSTGSGVQSNRKLVRNALERYCLKGDANKAQRDQILQAFDTELQSYERFIILFRSLHTGRHDLRALYAYQEGMWVRVVQALPSPPVMEERMVAQCLRYDSGGKQFKEVPAVTELLNVADAVFLHPQFLQRSRVVVQ